MQKILLLGVVLLSSQITFAQEQRYDWKTMKPDQRKEIIQKMNPKERTMLLNQFREDMMVSELDVPKTNEEEFKTLYAEYQEKQAAIKRKFKSEADYESLSDDEATKQLNQSFEIGQELLDNRKMYAQKFMQVIKPQQVLQMYQTEGKMRNKIIDKKQDGLGNPSSQRRRP
ncbi:hypothetical protein [Chryseobacterium sp. MP_3.2]|uniref:hypothetical protein n=1 Tax=Chryseobacterium sp. MP_3.2 TaxID=3071712 RepID=UPI002E028CD5|nr:putative Fe-S protein YdhL (DUF1289 family) [Chryseobacterium sp. MP_3.2]